MAVRYFPNSLFLKNGILKNFSHKISMNMLLSSSFWYVSGQSCGTFFLPHGLLSINVKVFVSFTGKNIFCFHT